MSSSGGTSSSESRGTVTVEQLIGECFVKTAQTVLSSRVHEAVSPASKERNAKRSAWFKLELQELDSARGALDRWRAERGVGLPLVLEIYLRPALSSASSPAHHQSPGTLLERWIIHYSPSVNMPLQQLTSGGGGGGLSRSQLARFNPQAVYKRLTLLIRSVYTYCRVLPAYRLYRTTCTASHRSNPTFSITYAVHSTLPHSSCTTTTTTTTTTTPRTLLNAMPTPTTPSRRGASDAAAAPFHQPSSTSTSSSSPWHRFEFSSVETAEGEFKLAVEYQPPSTVRVLGHAAIRVPRPAIIQNYVQRGNTTATTTTTTTTATTAVEYSHSPSPRSHREGREFLPSPHLAGSGVGLESAPSAPAALTTTPRRRSWSSSFRLSPARSYDPPPSPMMQHYQQQQQQQQFSGGFSPSSSPGGAGQWMQRAISTSTETTTTETTTDIITTAVAIPEDDSLPQRQKQMSHLQQQQQPSLSSSSTPPRETPAAHCYRPPLPPPPPLPLPSTSTSITSPGSGGGGAEQPHRHRHQRHHRSIHEDDDNDETDDEVVTTLDAFAVVDESLLRVQEVKSSTNQVIGSSTNCRRTSAPMSIPGASAAQRRMKARPVGFRSSGDLGALGNGGGGGGGGTTKIDTMAMTTSSSSCTGMNRERETAMKPLSAPATSQMRHALSSSLDLDDEVEGAMDTAAAAVDGGREKEKKTTDGDRKVPETKDEVLSDAAAAVYAPPHSLPEVPATPSRSDNGGGSGGTAPAPQLQPLHHHHHLNSPSSFTESISTSFPASCSPDFPFAFTPPAHCSPPSATTKSTTTSTTTTTLAVPSLSRLPRPPNMMPHHPFSSTTTLTNPPSSSSSSSSSLIVPMVGYSVSPLRDTMLESMMSASTSRYLLRGASSGAFSGRFPPPPPPPAAAAAASTTSLMGIAVDGGGGAAGRGARRDPLLLTYSDSTTTTAATTAATTTINDGDNEEERCQRQQSALKMMPREDSSEQLPFDFTAGGFNEDDGDGGDQDDVLWQRRGEALSKDTHHRQHNLIGGRKRAPGATIATIAAAATTTTSNEDTTTATTTAESSSTSTAPHRPAVHMVSSAAAVGAFMRLVREAHPLSGMEPVSLQAGVAQLAALRARLEILGVGGK